jgi:glycogen operon protein
MSDNDWDNGYAKSVGVLLNGSAISTPDAFGGRVVDDSFLLLFNASELDLPWTLPADSLWPGSDSRGPNPWMVELDSALVLAAGTEFGAEGDDDVTVPLKQRSVVVLRSAT